MSEEYGNDFISISDEDGNEFELELLDSFEVDGTNYMVFLPANMDEDDEDFGLVIMKTVEENGEEVLSTLDSDEELDKVYNIYMERLFAEEDEEADED